MDREIFRHVLAVARGDAPADLLFAGAKVANVFTGELALADVAVARGYVAAVGQGYRGEKTVDCRGGCLVPGLIDSHVHIESSMVNPAQFARAVTPHGVTTVVADPHEIANVAGRAGILYMLQASAHLPLAVFINLPSCVPATSLGTAGAVLEAEDLARLQSLPRVLGLAEFMNVPGVALGLPGAIDKLLAFAGCHIDGHAPGLTGKWLQAYIAAGPSTDHESITVAEAREKVGLGMRVLLREGTAAKNLLDLLPAVTAENAHCFAFCTDDRHPADLIDQGSIDHCVRLAVASGLSPMTAIRMATMNAAAIYGLRDRGAIAPGRLADLVLTPSLEHFQAEQVYAAGRLVAERGAPVGPWAVPEVDDAPVRGSVKISCDTLSFAVPAGRGSLRVIGIVPEQIITEERIMTPLLMNGEAVADTDRDLLKLAVVERHTGRNRTGLGFVHGMGLKKGAIAGSIGHDCHNVTVAGATDADMLAAVATVVKMGGGLAAVLDGAVIGQVPLPIAGLMSDQPLEQVRAQMDRLLWQAGELGSPLRDPFMHLGFLALEVIPKLKLTDQGLVDVDAFGFVPLWTKDA